METPHENGQKKAKKTTVERTEAQKAADKRNLELAQAKMEEKALERVECRKEAPEGSSEEYGVMWHVANNLPRHDRSPNEKRTRLFMKLKPGEFNAQLTSLAKEHRMSRVTEKKLEAVVDDVGTDRALEKVEELLGKLEGG